MRAKQELEKMEFQTFTQTLTEKFGKVDERIEETKSHYKHVFVVSIKNELLDGLFLEVTLETPKAHQYEVVYSMYDFVLNGVKFNLLQEYATMIHWDELVFVSNLCSNKLLEMNRKGVMVNNVIRDELETLRKRFENKNSEQFYDLEETFFASKHAGMFEILERKAKWEAQHNERMTERLLQEIVSVNVQQEIDRALEKNDLSSLKVLAKLVQA